MNIWKKVLAVTVVAVMASAVLYEGMYGTPTENPGQIPGNALVHKKTVNIWYTDEALSDFLASAALDFSESRNVRVIPRLVSGLEYLETINQESRTSNSIPDLYIVGNESLEKAYLSGLACEVWDDGFVSEENFPESALRAVTYIDKIVAYPFYYETSALIYNKTYMEEHARTILEAEADAIAGEEAMAELEDDGEAETETETASVMYQEEEISERMDTLIPSSMEDILSFADTYEAPEQVEAVFKWDVSDIFYNYFFVGNYVNVGGPDGDDTEQIDIYNLDAIRCLQSYQQLNQFFSIEADEVDYNSVVQEFLEGKLVFTVATTDVVSRIEEAKQNGQFPYEYGVTNVPDIDGELVTRSMSETHAVAINGYSEQKEIANEFARYLTEEAAAELFDRTGKLPSGRNVELSIPQAESFFAEYEVSVPIPKMMETSNYWVKMEVAFTKIWEGDEVSLTLKELSEQIMTQITGTPFVEEYIPVPVDEDTEGETEE